VVDDAEARVREAMQRALRAMPTSARIIASMYLAPRVLAAIRAAAGATVDMPWNILYARVQERAMAAALGALSSGEAEETR
jgi:hypothetical protein